MKKSTATLVCIFFLFAGTLFGGWLFNSSAPDPMAREVTVSAGLPLPLFRDIIQMLDDKHKDGDPHPTITAEIAPTADGEFRFVLRK